ncbi:hypothetical protein ACJ73_04542 [Blastomyces percursus]|uniref:Isochorismatase-like domain-containing protein n=1 Tax=Blastomyces percursus TaxID=1658174 RepID=A0A1J9Q6C8_9EURO|nr:hypothetical protein ACJ73_04542 [Blastomyces percursus]
MLTSTLRFSPRFPHSSTPSTSLHAAKHYSRSPIISPARMSSTGTTALARNAKAERIRQKCDFADRWVILCRAVVGNPALLTRNGLLTGGILIYVSSICDIQEKFRPVIYEFPKLITTTTKLLKAAKPLNIPIYITTQNRARLGATVSEFNPYLNPASNPNVRADLDKTLFSMVTPELKACFPTTADGQQEPLDAIIVGIESHICVSQTTLDLLALGHRVYVVADGVSSVNPEERVVALARLRDAGAIVTTSESLLFEIMGDAKHALFRQISGLVKESGEETKAALGVFCGSKI